jgi:hypothetical protein
MQVAAVFCMAFYAANAMRAQAITNQCQRRQLMVTGSRGHFHIKEVSKKAVAHILNTEIMSGDFSSPVDL